MKTVETPSISNYLKRLDKLTIMILIASVVWGVYQRIFQVNLLYIVIWVLLFISFIKSVRLFLDWRKENFQPTQRPKLQMILNIVLSLIGCGFISYEIFISLSSFFAASKNL